MINKFYDFLTMVIALIILGYTALTVIQLKGVLYGFLVLPIVLTLLIGIGLTFLAAVALVVRVFKELIR